MTVMFHDIHKRTDRRTVAHRVPGTDYDEVMYADDTICIATDTRTMNKMIDEVEKEGGKYGMKLNRKKCEV
jgi:hypothetical protein